MTRAVREPGGSIAPDASGTPGAAGRAAGGLLAVHAHPDDETLSTGALLATWAAAGRPVTVVTCTRGEQGEVIPEELAHLEGDGPALAAHREAELGAALEALEVTDHVFLDRVPLPDDDVSRGPARYVDSGMVWADTGRATTAERIPAGAFVAVDLDEAASRLAAVLRARRPDVVVGYEPGGGYGHPDHVRAHEVMHRAVALAADPRARVGGSGARVGGSGPWRVPVLLWAVLDAAAVREARRELTDDSLTPPDPNGPLPSCAVDRASIDLEVDGTTVLDRVVAAMRAHVTQIQAVRVRGAGHQVAQEQAAQDRAAQEQVAGGQVAGEHAAGERAAQVGGVHVAVARGRYAPGRHASGRYGHGQYALGQYALSDGVLTPLMATECYRLAATPELPRAVGWPPGVVRVAADPPAPTVP